MNFTVILFLDDCGSQRPSPLVKVLVVVRLIDVLAPWSPIHQRTLPSENGISTSLPQLSWRRRQKMNTVARNPTFQPGISKYVAHPLLPTQADSFCSPAG